MPDIYVSLRLGITICTRYCRSPPPLDTAKLRGILCCPSIILSTVFPWMISLDGCHSWQSHGTWQCNEMDNLLSLKTHFSVRVQEGLESCLQRLNKHFGNSRLVMCLGVIWLKKLGLCCKNHCFCVCPVFVYIFYSLCECWMTWNFYCTKCS